MQRRRPGWARVGREEPRHEEPTSARPEATEVEQLRWALSRLDRKHRLVLVLRFYLDLSNEEVGRTIGVSAAAARVRVQRALARLRPGIAVPEELGDG